MKKMFEVLNSYDKAAKLANFRARIVRDSTTEWPSDSMDMIYHPKSNAESAHELFGFSCSDQTGQKFIFTCDPEKLKAEMKAIPEDKRTSWLEGIKNTEQEIFQKFISGEVYEIIFEKWNADAREWNSIDAIYGFYGWDNLKDYFETSLDHDIDCICIDSSELGDVKNWSAKFQTMMVKL